MKKGSMVARIYVVKPLAEVINGFKIIKDLGFVKSETAIHPYRLCIAECKKCLKYFNARPTDLRKISSCLCKRLPIVMMDNHRLKNISNGEMESLLNELIVFLFDKLIIKGSLS